MALNGYGLMDWFEVYQLVQVFGLGLCCFGYTGLGLCCRLYWFRLMLQVVWSLQGFLKLARFLGFSFRLWCCILDMFLSSVWFVISASPSYCFIAVCFIFLYASSLKPVSLFFSSLLLSPVQIKTLNNVMFVLYSEKAMLENDENRRLLALVALFCILYVPLPYCLLLCDTLISLTAFLAACGKFEFGTL